jgi:hypothetical protein
VRDRLVAGDAEATGNGLGGGNGLFRHGAILAWRNSSHDRLSD